MTQKLGRHRPREDRHDHVTPRGFLERCCWRRTSRGLRAGAFGALQLNAKLENGRKAESKRVCVSAVGRAIGKPLFVGTVLTAVRFDF